MKKVHSEVNPKTKGRILIEGSKVPLTKKVPTCHLQQLALSQKLDAVNVKEIDLLLLMDSKDCI